MNTITGPCTWTVSGRWILRAGRPEVDPGRIAVRGTSQGGALGMAVCALDGRPALGIVNVPSNSDIETRIAGRHGSFSAAADFLMRYRIRRIGYWKPSAILIQ